MKYMKLIIPVFIISCFPSQSSGAGCINSVLPMLELPMDKFLGTWYEYKFFNRVYDTPGRCTTFVFSKNQQRSDIIDVKITDRIRYNLIEHHAQLQREDLNDKSGFFKVSYFYTKQPLLWGKQKTKVAQGVLKVIGTDGDCWAVIYSCERSFLLENEATSVLIKDKDLKCATPEKRGEINNALTEVGLDLYAMHIDDMLGCP